MNSEVTNDEIRELDSQSTPESAESTPTPDCTTPNAPECSNGVCVINWKPTSRTAA